LIFDSQQFKQCDYICRALTKKNLPTLTHRQIFLQFGKRAKSEKLKSHFSLQNVPQAFARYVII